VALAEMRLHGHRIVEGRKRTKQGDNNNSFKARNWSEFAHAWRKIPMKSKQNNLEK
jgi:hypothetical protein